MVCYKPLVSIIVPNYNHERYLQQRLESIFNQTYTNFEVILLDDCSTDCSLKILHEYAENPKVSHCIFNETNSGNTFIQWNKGIALAKGDFIWIAESDDFCELNFLEELIKPLLHDDKIVLSYCQSKRVDEFSVVKGDWLNYTDSLDNTFFLKNFILEGNEFIERFLIYRNVIPNASGVLFRKKNVRNLGELDIDPILKTCGDWLFYLKLITNNNIAYISESLNNFRYHSESVIAGAGKKIKWSSLIEIDFKMRAKMIDYLFIKNPCNYMSVIEINREIIKQQKYELGTFYFRNSEKIKGVLILFTLICFFIKKKLKKN